jgi:hypothetical protein
MGTQAPRGRSGGGKSSTLRSLSNHTVLDIVKRDRPA